MNEVLRVTGVDKRFAVLAGGASTTSGPLLA
jgi:hypothetical protein